MIARKMNGGRYLVWNLYYVSFNMYKNIWERLLQVCYTTYMYDNNINDVMRQYVG